MPPVYINAYKCKQTYAIKLDMLRMEIYNNNRAYFLLKQPADNIGNVITRRYYPVMELKVGTKSIFRIIGKVIKYIIDYEENIIELELEIDWNKTKWDISKDTSIIEELKMKNVGDKNE